MRNKEVVLYSFYKNWAYVLVYVYLQFEAGGCSHNNFTAIAAIMHIQLQGPHRTQPCGHVTEAVYCYVSCIWVCHARRHGTA